MEPYLNYKIYKSKWLKDIIKELSNLYNFNPSNMKIMDLGAGQGLQSMELSELFKKVYAVEPSIKMLKWARNHKRTMVRKNPNSKNNLSKIRFIKGDFKNIPIKKVDIILTNNTLHFSQDIDEALNNILEHLSDDGFLLILEPTNKTKFNGDDKFGPIMTRSRIKKKRKVLNKAKISINKCIYRNCKITLLDKNFTDLPKNSWFLKKI